MHSPDIDRKEVYSGLFQSLDVMSTYKVTSCMLTQQHFTEVILVFITKETDVMLMNQISEINVKSCPKCADLLDNYVTKPAVVALRIACRAFTFQVEALLSNDFSVIERSQGILASIEDFQPSSMLMACVFRRFMQEIHSQAIDLKYNFELLYLLCRAMVNMILLSRD
jgi:hypothetical protein